MFKFTVRKILKSAMEKGATASASGSEHHGPGSDYHNEFFNTGRAGRRNAMPDILGHHCTTSTADLPDQMGALSTQDQPSTSVSSSSSSNDAGTNNTAGASSDAKSS